MFVVGVLSGIAISLLGGLLLLRAMRSGVLRRMAARWAGKDEFGFWDFAPLGKSGRSFFGLNGALVLLALILLVLAVVIFAIRDDVTLTVLVALLGMLAAGCGWTIKNGRDSLYKRARLLIIESLDHRDMSRPEIRTMIYTDSFLFRLNKSTYIDALNDLYSEQVVTRNYGRYEIVRRAKS